MSAPLNLTVSRGPSVWQALGGRGRPQAADRWALGFAAGVTTAWGLARRSWSGTLVALAGAIVGYRAVKGYQDLETLDAWLARLADALRTVAQHADDRVEASSAESFPASDAPAWTPVAGVKL